VNQRSEGGTALPRIDHHLCKLLLAQHSVLAADSGAHAAGLPESVPELVHSLQARRGDHTAVKSSTLIVCQHLLADQAAIDHSLNTILRALNHSQNTIYMSGCLPCQFFEDEKCSEGT
jgi:hypothetical protein